MKQPTPRHNLISRLAARRGQDGMTLIEIMVVLTLLGLLMTVLAVNFFGMAEEQKVKITITQMKTLQGRLDAFKQEYGRYPSTSEGLQALVSPPPKKNGRTPGAFLDNADLLSDPWDNTLQYFKPARDGTHKYEIVSLGSDAAAGGEATDADISNWQGM